MSIILRICLRASNAKSYIMRLMGGGGVFILITVIVNGV